MITLRYMKGSCEDSEASIQCSDVSLVTDSAKALLLCVDGNGNSLNVEPDGLFEKNDLLIISNSASGSLDQGINCALFDDGGTMLQSYALSHDHTTGLFHGQTIGAFQLMACGDDEISCLVELQYEIAIYNDANNSAVLSDVTLVSMDGSKAVLQEMIEQVISPNDSLTGIYRVDIDICSTDSLQTGLLVEVSD